MTAFIAEIIGTALLILLGNGVVANVVLRQTKGNNSGWIVITFGWSMAVFVAVTTVGKVSGAHLNPAVTLGLAAIGKFAWELVPGYIAAQLLGAGIGQTLVWLFYRDHFALTPAVGDRRACFCTEPAIRKTGTNLLSEIIGTFVLVYVVFFLSDAEFSAQTLPDAKIGLGSVGALPVALLVFGIGLSLGGTTGYAINPARDLAPRFVFSLIERQSPADWGYAWIPVVGPVLGAILAAGFYLALAS